MASSSSISSSVTTEAPQLTRRLVWILAIASALIVANLYYMQPLLADVARSFQVSEGQVGTAATLGQIGYALGLLLLVPLGDRLNRRVLIVGTLLAVAVALLAVAFAPHILWLTIASFAVGACTIGAQIIIPFAASIAKPNERGQAVGSIMSGLLIGILLARTVSGFVSAQFGWQAMFVLAAIMMLGLALVLWLNLPSEHPKPQLSYLQLLRSLGEMLGSQPMLREASLIGAMIFGSFSAFWVTLAFFLETPPYAYGSEVAGLFGLVGMVGALAASAVGKLADRMDARRISGITLGAILLSFIIFWLLGGTLWGLAIGVILLDLGVQATHISNQTRVYALIPEARSRLNTVYMVSYFLGGALGSALGTFAWSVAGWAGVCIVGSLMIIIALITYGMGGRKAQA